MTGESRSDPGRHTHGDRASVGGRVDPLAVGLSAAFSCLAIASGVTALSTGSAAYRLGVSLAGAASVAIALGVLGLVFVFVALRFDRRLEAGLYRIAAGLVTLVGAGAAIGFASSLGEEPDLYRLFDRGGAVVFVVVGCLLGVTGTGAACFVLTQHAVRHERTGFVAGALAVVVTLGLVVPLASGYADKPWRPVEVSATTTPPVPTEIGQPAFRVTFDSQDLPNIVAAGPGFVALSGRTVTAYDGSTGAERWSFGFGDFTVGKESDPSPGIGVTDSASGDIVQVRNLDVTVELDSNTGRMIGVRRVEPMDRADVALPGGGVVRNGRGDSTDDDRRVAVLSPEGHEIDSFTLPSNFVVDGQAPDGYLILRSLSMQELKGQVMVRDIAAHTNRTLPIEKLAGEHIDVEKIVAVGDRMLVTTFREAFLVDPVTGAVEQVDASRWCASSEGAIYEVTIAAGAVLVTCGHSGLGAPISEVVGLR